MAGKRERFNISVSFTKEETDIYEYAGNQPNTSYYIKKLIKEDMKKEEKATNTIQEIDFNVDVNDYLNLI